MENEALDIFQEPEGFYQADKQPTYVSHRMIDGRDLSLRLIGHSPLWVGHFCQAIRARFHLEGRK